MKTKTKKVANSEYVAIYELVSRGFSKDTDVYHWSGVRIDKDTITFEGHQGVVSFYKKELKEALYRRMKDWK
jgi:hypothetical protein